MSREGVKRQFCPLFCGRFPRIVSKFCFEKLKKAQKVVCNHGCPSQTSKARTFRTDVERKGQWKQGGRSGNTDTDGRKRSQPQWTRTTKCGQKQHKRTERNGQEGRRKNQKDGRERNELDRMKGDRMKRDRMEGTPGPRWRKRLFCWKWFKMKKKILISKQVFPLKTTTAKKQNKTNQSKAMQSENKTKQNKTKM